MSIEDLMDLSSTATIRNSNDLTSSAVLQFINTLDINYLIEAMETVYDVDSNASVSMFLDLLGTAMIRAKGNTDLNSIVHSSWYKDLLSSAYKPYKFDLDSFTRVTDQNIMDIIFNLIQAPITVLTCNAVQDAYIREARPTLNYGTAQSLIVGNPLEGQYEFLLQLDISPYNNIHIDNNINVVQSDLVLTTVGSFDSSVIIDVYEVGVTWGESTVDWANFPQQSYSLINSFNCVSSVVKINLTNYINQRQINGYNNLNLLFKARNATSGQLITFESRDSTTIANRPHLEIQYQDPNWIGYTKSADLNSTTIIRAINAKDLSTSATVRRFESLELDGSSTLRQNKTKDLYSDATVRKNDNLDMESTALGVPNTDIFGSAILRRSDKIDINSTSNLYNKLDLDSIVDIRTSLIWLYSNATVRQVGTPELNSIVNVRHNIDLISNAITRLSNSTEIISNSTIRNIEINDLDSNVIVQQVCDLLSDVDIRLTKDKDLVSKSTSRLSSYNDLDSTVFVKMRTDLPSTANKRVTGGKDLSSKFTSRLSSYLDLDSTAYVKVYKDLPSNAIKRVTAIRDLDSTASLVNSVDLDSSVTIVSTIYSLDNDLNSTSIVRLTKNLDIDSTVIAQRTQDLASSVTVRVCGSHDLNSQVILNRILDLSSTARISQIKDLASNSIIRLTKSFELESTAIIRQYDIIEIDANAYMLGAEMLQLDSDVMISRFEVDYLTCYATIQTSARQWIPNVHGQDVFKFNNRKLPRLWKRENFIP